MPMTYELFTNSDRSLQGGDQQRLALSITRAQVQDGVAIDLPSPGVTAFVGGNNVGKSTLLRQATTWLGTEAKAPLGGPALLDHLELFRSGSPADLLSWLFVHRPTAALTHGTGVKHAGGLLSTALAVHYWSAEGGRMGALGSVLTYYADTQQRLAMSQPAERRQDFTEPASNPLQALEDDPPLLAQLSCIARDAFGQGLVLDPLSGHLLLRVGDPGVQAPPVDAISPEYREVLGRLAPLHEQGDGMRSMIGLLLPIIASTYPIVVVDEPEAFLHPPQARILGRELATLAQSRGIQIILATHDKNILSGLLDATDAPVSVVRLTRQEDRTTASQIPANNLRAVWADASLRYSNILDGLFHRAVVLAENERDCRFFTAALEAAHRDSSLAISPHDVLFVPTAGKTNMRPLAFITRACGVPTVASADLDLLNEENTLRALLEALGGEWPMLSSNHQVATAQFRRPKIQRQNRDVLSALAGVLNAEPGSVYDSETKKRVLQALSVDNPWQAVKDFG